MVRRNSTHYLIQPRNPDAGKEYGRGNRLRKQINYSDEAIDDQVFNITEYDDDENNAGSNDYTPVEVPRRRDDKVIRPKEVDIDQLILKEKPNQEDEAFFEDDDN